MENKKAFSLLLMPLQLMEITLNCFRIHICIMTTLYTLGFKTAEQGRFGYNKVSSCTYQPQQPNCTKLLYVMSTVTLKADTIGTVPYLRDAETHYYTYCMYLPG